MDEALAAYRDAEAAFADPERAYRGLETTLIGANIGARAELAANDTPSPAPSLRGGASFYKQPPGSKTATGSPFDPTCFCAAMYHRPGFHIGDTVRVQLQSDPSRHVDVRINDTGPFEMDADRNPLVPLRPHPDRVIDLTPAAMEALLGPNYVKIGIVPVIVTKLPDGESSNR